MPEPQPHVVRIAMDELALGALRSHTSHLQRLAAQSLDFRNAYTAGAVSHHPPSALPLDRPTLYTCLRAAGYRTAQVGECHDLPVPDSGTRPWPVCRAR